jgi:dihydrofolate synthase/folylpolyglutamate synthase
VTYDEAIEWLLSFADFERSGRFQDRPDVAPMLALLERLGNPHLGRATIHIAGSKGKGSVAAMVQALLDDPGISSGLYTSPHLIDYTERIRMLDTFVGGDIEEADFADLVAGELRPAVNAELSSLRDRQFVTFDLLTALAFVAFRKYALEVQVLEVGLGGRVDSTNVFETKEVAVITPISLEHVAILGDTVEQIAREKAAIITPGCGVVLAPQSYSQAKVVVNEAADKVGARVTDVASEYSWRKLSHDFDGQDIRVEGPNGVTEARLPLLGTHQIENAATAFATVRTLDRPGIMGYDWTSRELGIGLQYTNWYCRIEVVREEPLVVVDGAHNRDSARRLAETLVEYFAADRVLFVVGCGSDKDVEGLAEELAPLASRVIAVRSEHPRAMEPKRIAEAFGRLNVDAEIVDNVAAAVDRAIASTNTSALICVAGSLFVAAEARAHVLGIRNVS